ncbi:unnamed protein product [Pieris macdunnoughi]|uniref:Uncharacterized protein n=1 Tax=Pieris macdunnoughi TaxID=345717 RepID=A0A821TMR2_9NEOP|nr:unnamed protein product [Pieris macdunnoughi]
MVLKLQESQSMVSKYLAAMEDLIKISTYVAQCLEFGNSSHDFWKIKKERKFVNVVLYVTNVHYRATAPRRAALELRPGALVTDRLPSPLWAVFTVSFYSLRVLRWLTGHGWHCDWFESRHRLSDGLDTLRHLVEGGQLSPVLDKVYFPQDFEAALAHACSDEAVGTTVIRFP